MLYYIITKLLHTDNVQTKQTTKKLKFTYDKSCSESLKRQCVALRQCRVHRLHVHKNNIHNVSQTLTMTSLL